MSIVLVFAGVVGALSVTCNGNTFVDGDGDGFFAHDGSDACVLAGGPFDCDDTNSLVSPASLNTFCDCVNPPAASEACDGFDNNCNGQVDEGVWFDADNDTFSAVSPPSAFDCLANRLHGDASHLDNDCNDHDASVHPGATEIPCDFIRQDCNGADLASTFVDHDGDNFFINTTPLTDAEAAACHANNIHFPDCNDNSASAHPGLSELDPPFRQILPNGGFGDGLDNDCNGLVDDLIGGAVRFQLSGQILNLDRSRKRTVYASDSVLGDSSDESCTNIVVELQLTNTAKFNDATNVIIQGKIVLSHGAKVSATVLGQLGQYGFKVDAKTGAITWVQFKLAKFDPAGVQNVQKIHLPICAHDASAPLTVHLAVVRQDQVDFDITPPHLTLSQ